MKVTWLWICAEVSCSTQEHLLEMSLCGITHEAPGSRHTPATRAQMAAKQGNYFNTKLRFAAQTLRGRFGILHVSLGIIEEDLCHGGMKTSGRFWLSWTGPGAVLGVQMGRCSYKLSLGGKQSIRGAVPPARWYKKLSFQSALLEFVVIDGEKCRFSVFGRVKLSFLSGFCVCFFFFFLEWNSVDYSFF